MLHSFKIRVLEKILKLSLNNRLNYFLRFIIVCLIIIFKYEFINKNPISWFFGRIEQLLLCVLGPAYYHTLAQSENYTG